MPHAQHLNGRTLIAGCATAPVLYSDVALSFWGGIDPRTGRIVDQHHPLAGHSVAGKVLAIPDGRGSCTGSVLMLELLMGPHAPAALVLSATDPILILGVLVAQALLGRSLPMVQVNARDHAQLANARHLRIQADVPGVCTALESHPTGAASSHAWQLHASAPSPTAVALSAQDHAMLAGKQGPAPALALHTMVQLAGIVGCEQLIAITRAHVDACIYTGPASLFFAQHLLRLGARFQVPTTLNAISVDRCGWRTQGVPADLATPPDTLAQCYMDMGATTSYTCAPYHLPAPPQLGEHIAWAESNAAVYANSVLGAKTAKYPDFLEVMAGLTGRSLAFGPHLDSERQPQVCIQVRPPVAQPIDTDFFALAGYACGLQAGRRVAWVQGLESLPHTEDDLRSFCAAFATTSASPLVHIAGCTPEARLGIVRPLVDLPSTLVDSRTLLHAWYDLNTVTSAQVDLVAIGNPHASLQEVAHIAQLCAGKRKAPGVHVMVTTSRHVAHAAAEAGHLATLEDFGVQVLQDICWCMVQEPLLPPSAQQLLTSSAKYAHYAGGLVGRPIRLASLSTCIQAAQTGLLTNAPPAWLSPPVPEPTFNCL